MLVRWTGKIKPGTELNIVYCHEDVFTTPSTVAGVTDIRERIAKGDKLGTPVAKKNYIDGSTNSPTGPVQRTSLPGKNTSSPRNLEFEPAESSSGQSTCSFTTTNSGPLKKVSIPQVDYLRQDPYESYEQAPGPRATLSQQ
ncbi:MAG: hypothetical protein U0746_04145 [Gemmataceae bacterium]